MSQDEGLWQGESPYIQSIRIQYERAGFDKWGTERVNGLCRLLQTDVYALCALCGEFRRSRVMRWCESGKWPIYMTLQFWKMERVRMHQTSPDQQDMLAAQLFWWDR
jgi:hypothetical protein